MKVASLSTVFPNPREPGLGLFVRARLAALSQLAEVKVLAPVPAVDYSNPRGKRFAYWGLPAARNDGDLEILQPKWIYPPGGAPWNVLCLFARALPALLRLRTRFAFDVLDAHFCYPEGAAAALLSIALNRPFVVTLRGSELMFVASRWRAAAMRFALRRAAAVISVSEELRNFAIANGAAPARAVTIPNGIDRTRVYPRLRQAARERFGMKAGELVIAAAAELIEAKGHHLVMEAVRRLRAEGLPVSLYIAGGVARGGAPFQARLRDLAGAEGLAGNVHFTGWLGGEDLYQLMSAADVFCLASYAEGWPNVVHEALACGAPVVASRVGATPEMLPDERFGFLVPRCDADALTVALRRALGKSWDRAAIARWGGARGWEDVAREAYAVLSAVAAGGAPAPVQRSIAEI